MKPLSGEALDNFLKEVPGWNLADLPAQAGDKISRGFNFKNFVEAMHFVERVADIAEQEEHHPDIHISYNKVNLELYTHSIGGLSENDFIVAAKIDALT